MVTSRDRELVQRACVEKLGFSEVDAKATVEKALQEITLAADFDRREQIGKAVIRLEDIYEKSMKIQEQKTALSTQKEINKLLALYSKDEDRQGESNTNTEELARIRDQIQPFQTQNSDVPVAEMVRLLLLDYMRLKQNATGTTQQAQRDDGGGKPVKVSRKPRTVSAATRRGSGKKSGGVKRS